MPLNFSILTFLFLFISGYGAAKHVDLYDLTCENLKNPAGINTTTPRFSWKIKSDKNGTEQKSFQLLVATNPSLLGRDDADLWNSGKIRASSSVLVPYQGKTLNSGIAAFWKVRIWDESGKASDWSPVSNFSIGLLNNDDWQASYIRFPSDAGFDDCPQLKKSFYYDKTGRLFLHVNSLGYHEVYLNGEKVGEGILSPAVTQFEKRTRAVTYDLTALAKKGMNSLIIWLGAGWFREEMPGFSKYGPLVKAQLEQVNSQGRQVIVVTDSSWLGRSTEYSRVTEWRSGNYGGDKVNARLRTTDFSGKIYDNGNWQPVSQTTVSNHQVSSQMVELNVITDRIKPLVVRSLGDKAYLVDMGKDLTGWFEIRFPKLEPLQEVTIEYCDALDEKGEFINQKQVDKYLAIGVGKEWFRNKFGYHAFRYIKISNLPEAPAIDSMNAFLIHTGYGLASGFDCSDQDLNKIHNMIFRTLRCLSLGGYLVDCPHLERLGYGGDGNASTETAQTLFDINPLYDNWLQIWADCIRENGDMPHTAPNPWSAGGGPYWCGFIITASWKTYLNYGDSSVLQKYYPVMQKWLGFVAQYMTDGLLRPWPETDYRGWYLGDWASPFGVDQTAGKSIDLVNNCFIAVCYDRMQKIATILGLNADANNYANKKEQLQKRIHQEFYNPTDNTYGTATQIDLTFPLLAGVVPPELKNAVAERLVHEIKDNRNGHFACGLVGIPVFTEWATVNHANDLMYSMLKKKGYPGYMYMIDNGATTTWEHWNGERSRIHNCYNGIGSWFYQALAGIRPVENVPAYQQVLILPQIPAGVTWTKAFKETPYGKLVVNWELKDKKLNMELEIPVGIEARVPIQSLDGKCLINGKNFIPDNGKSASVSLKSGKYRINYDYIQNPNGK